jgi:Animal haem peroxidase
VTPVDNGASTATMDAPEAEASLEALDVPAHHGHGSESFFIVGEGMLGESGGGRDLSAAADGAAPPADGATALALQAATAAPPFRFSRMGPKGKALPKAIRGRVAKAMTKGGGGEGPIPAGYTYLGQFIDHDLTMDRTVVTLGANVAPVDLLQGRSPALDLDSLYGAGPSDPGSERFYEDDGRHLKMGKTEAVGSGVLKAHQGFDLPRDASHKHAIIPDFRNDENLAVAQTHLAMIRFHNRVIDELSSVPETKRFGRARRLVTKHYQWMIRHDYLMRVCDHGVVNDVFTNGRKAFEAGVAPTEVPTMPIEFSVAAFRLGHSMIRRAYDWNREFPGDQGTLDFLFTFSGTSGFLGNGARLPSNWIADFRHLYPFEQAALKVPPAKFNHAMRIDTLLVNPLSALPPGSFGADEAPADVLESNLAFRNLARAKMVRLASGQQMVKFLQGRGVGVTALTKAQIRDGNGGADLSKLTNAQRATFLEQTPLWFYILREAELNGGRLTGVGARIVAETMHRAMEGSRTSIVRDPGFKPRFGPNDHTFDMRDLLFFAFEGKKDLLAPLGD